MNSPQAASTQKNDPWYANLSIYLSLVITGVGIGWLVGLSVSPVVSIVVTSVIGSAAAIVAALSGLEDKGKDAENAGQFPSLSQALDPLPIATLVVGLVIGSFLGVRARTHDWLEPDISLEIEKWVGAGIPREVIVSELFNRQFSSSAAAAASQSPDEGVLFAIGSNECDSLRGKSGDELVQALATSAENPQLQQLPKIVQDADVLEELVEKMLCPA